MIYYGKFQKSLKRLQEQYVNYLELDQIYPEFILEAMSESVVQRFEKCYDALWKTLRRYLIEELGVVGAQTVQNRFSEWLMKTVYWSHQWKYGSNMLEPESKNRTIMMVKKQKPVLT